MAEVDDGSSGERPATALQNGKVSIHHLAKKIAILTSKVSQRRIDTTWERLMSHAQLGPQNISSASGGNKSESGRLSALNPKRPISANTAGHLNTNGSVNTVSNLPTLLQPVNALSERLELITKQSLLHFQTIMPSDTSPTMPYVMSHYSSFTHPSHPIVPNPVVPSPVMVPSASVVHPGSGKRSLKSNLHYASAAQLISIPGRNVTISATALANSRPSSAHPLVPGGLDSLISPGASMGSAGLRTAGLASTGWKKEKFGVAERTLQDISVSPVRPPPIQLNALTLLHFVLDRVALPATHQQFFPTMFFHPLSQSLYLSLFWYFYCRYFQRGSDSDEAQQQLLILISEYHTTLTRLARSKQPSFPPGASNLPNFLDIHFQTLSFAMSEAVFVALLCLFPGSRFILTSDLQRQLDCDVHQLLNGYMPANVSQQANRNLVFPIAILFEDILEIPLTDIIIRINEPLLAVKPSNGLLPLVHEHSNGGSRHSTFDEAGGLSDSTIPRSHSLGIIGRILRDI